MADRFSQFSEDELEAAARAWNNSRGGMRWYELSPNDQYDWMLNYTARPAPKPQDNVNHPAHYTFGKIEVIDVLDDWKLCYNRSCVIKYVARAGRKDPSKELEDLEKARWYLDREIQKLTKLAGCT